MTEAASWALHSTNILNLQEYKTSIVNNKMCVLQFNVQVSLLIATVPNLKFKSNARIAEAGLKETVMLKAHHYGGLKLNRDQHE